MGEVLDLVAYRAKKYGERRKGIQELTGMVGQPIDLASMIAPEEYIDPNGDLLKSIHTAPFDDIGY
jgi:hypothetical protein